jgi:hypothetical protein
MNPSSPRSTFLNHPLIKYPAAFFFILFLLVCLCPLSGSDLPQGPFFSLTPRILFGWVTFPWQIQLSPAGLLATLAVFLIPTALLYLALRRLLPQMLNKIRPDLPPLRPRLALTCAALLTLLTLTLMAALSSFFSLAQPGEPVGRYHLATRFTSTPEGALRSAFSVIATNMECHQEAIQTGRPPRPASFTKLYTRVHDIVQIGYIPRPDGTLYAAYAIPRDPQALAELGIHLFIADAKTGYPVQDERPPLEIAANWPAILQSLQEQAKQAPPKDAP